MHEALGKTAPNRKYIRGLKASHSGLKVSAGTGGRLTGQAAGQQGNTETGKRAGARTGSTSSFGTLEGARVQAGEVAVKQAAANAQKIISSGIFHKYVGYFFFYLCRHFAYF